MTNTPMAIMNSFDLFRNARTPLSAMVRPFSLKTRVSPQNRSNPYPSKKPTPNGSFLIMQALYHILPA
jgi:hypothetical protein